MDSMNLWPPLLCLFSNDYESMDGDNLSVLLSLFSNVFRHFVFSSLTMLILQSLLESFGLLDVLKK